MSGLRLAEMEATDMVDVLHYFFEEDLAVASAEQMEARSNARSSVYRTLYGTTYKYEMKSKSGVNGSNTYAADGTTIPTDGFFGDDDITPFDPTNNVPKETKPYIPPTDMDADSPLPFGKTLDAPLN